VSAPPARSVAALGVHTLATRLAIYVSAFGASVLIARGLGASGNGLYATAMTIGTMAAMFGTLGFEQSQARVWSRAEHSRAALYGSAIRVAAVTGSAGAAFALAFWALGRDSLFAGFGLGPAIVIVAACVPFRVLLTLVRGLLVVGGEIERSNVALAIGDVARTLTIVVLALVGGLSVETVVGALWVAVLVSLALHVRGAGRPERPPAGLVATQLRDGAVLSPYFAFLFLNQRLDVLLLAALATTRAVGVYAVAVIFAELIWLVTDAINTGARERQWSASADDALAATASAARMSLLLALLALPLLAIAAPPAIALLFGSAFSGAREALWALLPAAVAMAWWRALSAGLVRFGRARAVNAVAFAALTANVTLNVLLIPPLGIAGAALASLGSYVLGALLAAGLLGARVGARELLPGPGDARRLVALLRSVRPTRAGDERG
jgi:O-antigen/teichoic acid export membrane protein